MYRPLTDETVIDYVRQSPVMEQIFLPDEEMAVVDLDVAQQWLLQRHKIGSIHDAIELVRNAQSG